jgi:hypothetical protein
MKDLELNFIKIIIPNSLINYVSTYSTNSNEYEDNHLKQLYHIGSRHLPNSLLCVRIAIGTQSRLNHQEILLFMHIRARHSRTLCT